MSEMRTIAFEIGTEEIPAFDLKSATEQLERLSAQALDDKSIPHGDIRVLSTPRRLIVLVSNVQDEVPATESTFRGPRKSAAFDEKGEPTKAALGFARGKGVDVSELEVREEDGAEYVFAVVRTDALKTSELLSQVLTSLITDISWPKSMHWGSRRELFSRPVRWLLALFGDEVIPLSFAGLESGRLTYGHRFLSPGPHSVADAESLESTLEGSFVVLTQDERERVIREGVSKIEEACGLTAVLPAKTLTEVINLSEYPTPLCASFDEDFLQVPEEIIVDAMLMHQRYFPLYDKDGKLSNRFIIVSNGDPAQADIIIDGNMRVVAARLYDAKFFYEEDLKAPLESYVTRLDEVVFQEKLGTMRDKTERVLSLSRRICLEATLDAVVSGEVERAALLAKADLVTNAVIEFTSVQGIMGSYYALAAGETPRVSEAIAEHYRPRFSGDAVPSSIVGRVVAMADKIDTICGLFAVDEMPTGSSDPFALRRAALGVIAILSETSELDVSLERLVDDALRTYAEAGIEFDKEAVKAAVLDFFVTRCKVLLKDEGATADSIEAVLAVHITEPLELARRVRALDEARTKDPELYTDLAIAYARANNLRDADLGDEVDSSLFTAPEQTLAQATAAASTKVAEAIEGGDYPAALTALASLRGPIDAFFDEVLIMDDDLRLRENRLKLLNRFVGVFASVADFGKISQK